jgi:hypothetical protein
MTTIMNGVLIAAERIIKTFPLPEDKGGGHGPPGREPHGARQRGGGAPGAER